MNFYRELFSLIFEIVFSIFIIIFGYKVWDTFDQTNYNIAKYYDNTKEVQIIYESNIDKGYKNNNSVVSVHNVSDKKNNKDIILKIDKNNNLKDITLNINTINYKLEELYLKEDEIYNYYLIENANLNGYETRIYFIDFNLNENKLLENYEFISEL